MPKVSAKRQITLPIDQCAVAKIDIGDDIESFVDRKGVISIVRKQLGAAKGILEKNSASSDLSSSLSLEGEITK
jgi:bifunctional DNA-binding transcriptional regulator/antitoxin component of YhaV-PrlF toxin-antitoxin module